MVRKRASTRREEQSPEGEIPGATQPEMVGRFEGEQGVKRGSNSEDARCREVELPGYTDPSFWRSL